LTVQFKFLSVEEKITIVRKFIIPETCEKMGYENSDEILIDNE
jgi:hypothetical protein